MSLADATLRMVLLGDDVSASAALRRVGDNASATEKRFALMSASMGKLGKTMTHAFTLPALAIAAGSAKMATDFSTAMTRIQTQAGASAQDVQTLSKQVLGLASKGIQQGPVDLANSLYHLKSVGMDNVDAMKALVASSHLAAVGNASLEDTTNALAGAWRTGIGGSKNFGHAVGAVNAIVGAGNMTLSDFNEAIGTGILPSAKLYGLKLKDVGSALALFTDENVAGTSAMTRLGTALSMMVAPSTKAAGVMDLVGLSGTKLGEALRKPNGLINAISMIKDHIQGLSKVAQVQDLSYMFGGAKSARTIMSLVNNLNVLKMKQDQVTNSMNKFGESVKKQEQTPQAQFHQLIATLETLGVELGDKLLPIFVQWADKLNAFVGWFQALPSGVQKLASSFGILLAAMGPMLIMTSKVIASYQKMSATMADTEKRAAMMRMGAAIGGMTALTVATETGSQKIKDFSTIAGTALLGFAAGGPIGAAVGGLAGVFTLLAQHEHAAAEAAKNSQADWSELKGTFDSLNGAIDANTRKTVENQLARTGSLKALATYGISTRTAVDAILGEGQARGVVSAALKNQTAAIAEQRHQIALLTQANIAAGHNGTQTPQAEASRKRQIDAYNAQIAGEQKVIATVKAGIPVFAAQHRAALQQAADTADLAGKLRGLPKVVRTGFQAGNILGTLRDIASVSKAYSLTPKQIRTVIEATNTSYTVGQVKKVEQGLAAVANVKPNLSTYQRMLQAQIDQAGGIARTGGANVGYAMAGGLAAALAADRARIAAQSADLVTNAINAARRAADAHSPSRKMIALGHDLMDGLLKGLGDRQQSLAQAMTKIQSVISSAVSKLHSDVQTRNQFAQGFQSFATSAFGMPLQQDANGNDVAPTMDSILTYAKSQRAQARTVKTDVHKLLKMGLSPALLKQLQAQGAAGLPELEALAAASKAQIRQYDRINAGTRSDLHDAGMSAANRIYHSQIAHDRAVVRELHNLVHELHELHAGKGETIVVEIDGERIIAAIKKRNKRKGVKTAGV